MRGWAATARHAYLDLAVVPDARKDTLAHASNDSRRIAHGLVDTNLNVIPAQKDRLSPQEGGSRLRRDARSRAPFGEQECNGFVEERLRRHAQPLVGHLAVFKAGLGREPWCGNTLEVEGVRDDALDLARAEVSQGH